MFDILIEKYWKDQNVLVGFAMDHGCHQVVGGCTPEEHALFRNPSELLLRVLQESKGFHGLKIPEDLNIVHFYKAHPAK